MAETKDQTALDAYHQRYLKAIVNGDVPELLSLHAAEAIVMPPNDTTLFGKGELEEWYGEYLKNFRVKTLEVVERDVTVSGDWAVERWTYMVAIQPLDGSERIRDDGRFLNVWKQDGGDWRIWQSMYNSIRPIGSGTSRFLVLLKQKSNRPSAGA